MSVGVRSPRNRHIRNTAMCISVGVMSVRVRSPGSRHIRNKATCFSVGVMSAGVSDQRSQGNRHIWNKAMCMCSTVSTMMVPNILLMEFNFTILSELLHYSGLSLPGSKVKRNPIEHCRILKWETKRIYY